MKRLTVLLAMTAFVMLGASSAYAVTEDEIDSSIVHGLGWLAAQQNPDGSWGFPGWPQTAMTGLAVKKFENFAVERDINPLDPSYLYYPQVKRGLNFIFSQASTIPIFPQPAGNPDSDGDGIGLFFVSDGFHRTYETGIALMAIAESDCADSVVSVPGPIAGWTYYDVAVDMVDYLAFGQNDAGQPRGGWGYMDNYVDWSDNSNSGYAVLGLAYATALPPHGFDIPIPPFVLKELDIWITAIQCNVPGPAFGGSGYVAACDWVNCLKTGNLLFQMALVGDLAGPRQVAAAQYLINHWYDGNPDPGWNSHLQAMYAVMKGLEFQGMDSLGTIDWYQDFATEIVALQHPDGSWGPDMWGNEVLATCWALLTLEKVAPPSELTVDIDIKPTSCPNPLNVKNMGLAEDPDFLFAHRTGIGPKGDNGVLPIAILGTADFDVADVDPATVLLQGVAPLRWAFEDVATPVVEDPNRDCECTTRGADGYRDMTLKFRQSEIIMAIGTVTDGQYVPLTLTGMLYDSTEIVGSDCVLIRAKLTLDDAVEPGSEPEALSNHPNPFNASTTIRYSLANEGSVRLVVYNVLGQQVATLVDGIRAPGEHAVSWEGRNQSGAVVPSGMYFYRLDLNGQSTIRSMTLLK